MNIEIADRLVELRRSKDLSQEELAGKLGVSRQAVSKWERAESSPDTDNLIALARLFEISLDDLLLNGNVSPADHGAPPIGGEWEEAERRRRKSMLLKFPYPLFATLCYLVLGFQWHIWHPSWLIFLTIPLYYWYAAVQ